MTEADITLTKSDPGALGPLLMTGQADAIIAWLTDVSRYTGQAAEAGKEIVILPWADARLELHPASLVASDRFLADRVIVMSARPGRVIADMPVPLDRPRDETSLRSPEIQDYMAHLRSLLIKKEVAQ